MLCINLPKDLEDQLNVLTEKTHQSKSTCIQNALRAYFDAYGETLLRVAEFEEQHKDGALKLIPWEDVQKKLGLI